MQRAWDEFCVAPRDGGRPVEGQWVEVRGGRTMPSAAGGVLPSDAPPRPAANHFECLSSPDTDASGEAGSSDPSFKSSSASCKSSTGEDGGGATAEPFWTRNARLGKRGGRGGSKDGGAGAPSAHGAKPKKAPLNLRAPAKAPPFFGSELANSDLVRKAEQLDDLPSSEQVEAARRWLVHGKETSRHAQDLARDALLAFFPAALVRWPDSAAPAGPAADVGDSSSSSSSAQSDAAVAQPAPPSKEQQQQQQQQPPRRMRSQRERGTRRTGGAAAAAATARGEAGGGGGGGRARRPCRGGRRRCECVGWCRRGRGTADGSSARIRPALADDAGEDHQGVLQLQLLGKYFIPAERLLAPGGARTRGGCGARHRGAPGEQRRHADEVNDAGRSGWPPLSLALLGGDANVQSVALLLEAGADLEACPTNRHSQTPLVLAAAGRQEGCLRTLIAAGAC